MPKSEYHRCNCGSTVDRLIAALIAAEARKTKYKPSDGRGFKAWETRRVNRFKAAVAQLTAAATAWDRGRSILIENAAAEISDFLSLRIPTSITFLPRGYELRLNAVGNCSLALGADLFAASPLEEPPSTESLQLLARDLASGWLAEVEQVIGGAL